MTFDKDVIVSHYASRLVTAADGYESLRPECEDPRELTQESRS